MALSPKCSCRLLLATGVAVVGFVTHGRCCAEAAPRVERSAPGSVPASFAPILKPHKLQPARLVNEGVRRRPPSAHLVPGHGRTRWGALDVQALLLEDRARAKRPGVPMRIGVNRPTPGGPVTHRKGGVWENLPDGGVLWSAQLEVPGAEAIRIHFSQFSLSPGSRFTVAGAEGTVPVTYSGSDPRRKGAFWTEPVAGEVAYLEYRDPAGRARSPKFSIDEVSHLYRGAAGGSVRQDAGATGGGVAALLPCQEDVSCWPVDEAARDSVGRMVFTIPAEGTFLCSGALLSDLDTNTSAGYFLTANHCIDSQAAADTLTVYWFYQSSICGGIVPSLFGLPTSSGATLLASSSSSDFSLLRLDDDPSDGQGFAAWTTDAPSQTVRGIHHPSGSFKRYSSGPVTTAQPICGGLPLSRYIYNDWDVGIIEGGSSGSPLFNEGWEVVGQLFGVCFLIEPDCDNAWAYNNVYGRFSSSYTSMSSYLTAIAPDDDFEDNDSVAEAAVIEAGRHELRLVDFDDYFVATVDAVSNVTVTATFDPSDMDLDLMLLDPSGAAVATSSGVSGSESVAASVTAGTYIVRVTKARGWGGSYSLDIDEVRTGCERPVAATLVANAAVGSKNRYLSFVPGNAGRSSALRVTLTSLHHPDPPNNTANPSPDFSWLEGTTMWVGPPGEFRYTEFPLTTFHAAKLTCTPHYMDWSTIGSLHVYGAEIVPSSVYEVQVIEEGCDPALPGDYSPALTLRTSRWGDVVEPFQESSPADSTQPDIGDVTAVLDAVLLVPSHMPKTVTQLRPTVPDPSLRVNVLDVSSAVDAFEGEAYPYTDLVGCP